MALRDDDNIEDRPASKKRGRPPKLASDFTPMKKASSSERVVSPKKFDVGGTEDLAQKLQVLSGIEIKRINTETGEEVDARLELEVKNAEIKKSPPKKRMVTLSVNEAVFKDSCEPLQSDKF